MNDVVVVNEKDEVIGTMPREQAHTTGVQHRIAVVYVKNSKDEILVQVRMSGRLDHSSAGHVESDETYEQAAYRELEEELGISGVKIKEIGSGTSVDLQAEKNINIAHTFKVFCCTAEPKKLQEGEVKDVYWEKPEEVLKKMQRDDNDDKYTRVFKESLKIYLK